MTDRNDQQHSVTGAVYSPAGDEVLLSYEPLDEAKALRFVRDASAGATCVFAGTTRDTFEGKSVRAEQSECAIHGHHTQTNW